MPSSLIAVVFWVAVAAVCLAQVMILRSTRRVLRAAAMVELNTRDPLFFEPAHHHVLRDLIAAVADARGPATQGVSVVAMGMRVVIEVLPEGQMIVFIGDRHLVPPVAAIIDQHSATR